MIDIDRLSKRFSGRTVVNDLSFRIDRGEIVGLLGPNGAGKSTTLKMLSGFLAPSAGSVRIFGFDMQDKARQAQKLIGYLPENAPSYGEMTVEGFLAFVASIRDYSGREKRRRIDSAMDCMELRDERRSIIETLSKGFKRRVALAQAILHDPDEALPPSNPQALANFVRVGASLGIDVELIGRKDYARLAEFDALLIRETTRVDHHTYRFAE